MELFLFLQRFAQNFLFLDYSDSQKKWTYNIGTIV